MNEDRRAMLGLWGLAFVAYGSALFGLLVYDDLHSVRDNESIRSLANIPSFFWDVQAFSNIDVRMYRPVLLVTFAVDHWIGGGHAWMFKLTSVMLHALNAMLVFSLVRALGVARTAAWIGAGLFAVHPLASEAVNMVSSRSDVLLTAGVLTALRAHVAWQDGARLAWIGVFAGALVACGSKATGVMLVPMCVVLEWTRGSSPWVARLARCTPAVVVAIGYLVARRILFGIATARTPVLTDGQDVLNGAGRDLVTQACVMSNVLPRFVTQSVAPFGMSLDPWIPLHDDWMSAPVLAGWAVLLTLTWLGLRAPRKRPLVFFGTAMTWLAALPWVLVPLNLPALEHRFYLPLAGLGCVLAGSLRQVAWRRPPVIAFAVLIGFAGLSAARSLEYRDAAGLWRSTLAQHPNSVRGLCGLAIEHRIHALERRAQGDEDGFLDSMASACNLLERAVSTYPEHYAARRNLVEFHIDMGEAGASSYAVELAHELVEIEPNNPFYRLLWSRALAFDARYDEAVDAALSCLEIAEPKGLVYRTAAGARASQGDLLAAIELLDRSVAQGLDHHTVLLQRADYLVRVGDVSRARSDLRRILQRDPFHFQALRMFEALDRAQPPR